MQAELRRARALIDAGQHDAGRRILASHLASEPDDVAALCLAARSLLESGRPQEAHDTASRALTVHPDDGALRTAALALVDLGKYTEALLPAARAVQLHPGSWPNHYVLALCRHRGGDNGRLALDGVHHALRLAPDEPALHRLAGAILSARGDRDHAYASFRRALQIDPTDAVARHEIGRLAYQRGSLAAAADAFGSAVALDPRLSVGVRNLRLVVIRLLQWLAAILFLATRLVHTLEPPPLIVPAVVTAVVVGGGLWFGRRAGRRLWPFLRSMWRTAPIVVAAALFCVVAYLLLWLPVFGRALTDTSSAAGIACSVLAFLCVYLAYRMVRRESARSTS